VITPAQIQLKAEKLWQSGRLLQAALEQEELFPWSISFRKPGARQQLDHFADIRAWVRTLQAHAGSEGDGGYQIEYKTINHRQMGVQQLPERIVFAKRDKLLQYIGKRKAFMRLLSNAQRSIEKYPALRDWLLSYPRKFMKAGAYWSQLLAVCDYFSLNPAPGCYMRELDIAGVDSKFIEKHRTILGELFDSILPAEAINQNVSGLRQHGFERRYGLKFEQALVRLRLLDRAQSKEFPVEDISLPVSQLGQWSISCSRVFITENKINGLSFPRLADSIVIFGLGYGVDSLAEIGWLSDCEIYYWGDIDTHGFSILSRLRHHFPKARALMMDMSTLETHQRLCVEEPANARCTNALTMLMPPEQALYQQLQDSHQRLEQERIPMRFVMRRIRAC